MLELGRRRHDVAHRAVVVAVVDDVADRDLGDVAAAAVAEGAAGVVLVGDTDDRRVAELRRHTDAAVGVDLGVGASPGAGQASPTPPCDFYVASPGAAAEVRSGGGPTVLVDPGVHLAADRDDALARLGTVAALVDAGHTVAVRPGELLGDDAVAVFTVAIEAGARVLLADDVRDARRCADLVATLRIEQAGAAAAAGGGAP